MALSTDKRSSGYPTPESTIRTVVVSVQVRFSCAGVVLNGSGNNRPPGYRLCQERQYPPDRTYST
jgi:hypothetical protein